jgi:PAS domain S-box-containing protein
VAVTVPFLLRRAKTWLPHRDDKDSLFFWLIAPFLLTALGLLALIILLRKFDGQHTYVTLYPAVIISSLLGGYRAGLVALLCSVGGVVWLFDQMQNTPDQLAVIAYVVDCLLIIGVCHAMTVAAQRTAEARAETRLALQLLKSEQLFRSFIEHAPAALAMFDKDMRYIGASQRWMSDFGIKDMSIQGKSYLEGSTAMPKEWAAAMRKALAGDISRQEEDLIVHADGRQRWLRWEVWPWINISGVVAGIIIFSEDITVPKEAASAAVASEARLRAIIESMQGAMIVTDADGNIESFNPAAIALFGYSEAELLESNIKLLIDDFRPGEEKSRRSRKRPKGEGDEALPNNPSDTEAKRKGGAVFPADQMITQWTDGFGEKHWTVIIRDISERRAGEEELGRTLRMEAVGRLAGGIAHDFNNLLSIITGNLELAEPQITHPKPHGMIQKALDAAERGAGFTQQLLTLARKRQSEFKEVDLNQHVSNIAALLEHTLGSNVRLRINLAQDLWITRADPVEIDSAIINLAMNAGHAMPTGGTLHISTSNVTIDPKRKRAGAPNPTGDFARISVRDSGTGMTREVRRRAFEPFFTTKGEGIGTGLGLPSVYSFAQAAGGFITLDSAVGKGTTLEMYIPRFVGGERSTCATTTVKRSRRKRGHGEIILVVEDDRDVREVSVERLKRLGYETLSTGSVSEACQILRQNRQIALVFSDIVLTGAKTGYDLARWVERHRPDVSILLTTGYDVGDKQLAQGKDNPLIRRLEKPHTATQLANEIRKALEIDPAGEL